jgi:hypothetical protein
MRTDGWKDVRETGPASEAHTHTRTHTQREREFIYRQSLLPSIGINVFPVSLTPFSKQHLEVLNDALLLFSASLPAH